MVNILVVDSNLVYRKGVLSILGDYPEFRVIGDASDCSEAAAKASDIQPDIVIMDVFTGCSEGVEGIRSMQQRFTGVKVIILTSSSKEGDFLQALKAGTRGYLLKYSAPMELIECIRLVASSDAIVSPSKAVGLFEQLGQANNTSRNWGNRLSQREKEVLRLVAQGASNKEIAVHCYVSETTVKAHLRKILEKMSVRNRAEAVAQASIKGLLNEL